MLRVFVCAVVALVIFAGGVLAGEATIVKIDKAANKVTLKVGTKEQVVEMKTVKIVSATGGEAKIEVLKEGDKVEVVEKDGKVTEIKITKK